MKNMEKFLENIIFLVEVYRFILYDYLRREF